MFYLKVFLGYNADLNLLYTIGKKLDIVPIFNPDNESVIGVTYRRKDGNDFNLKEVRWERNLIKMKLSNARRKYGWKYVIKTCTVK